jgi:hypothetical protein
MNIDQGTKNVVTSWILHESKYPIFTYCGNMVSNVVRWTNHTDWSSIFILILILGLIFEYNLYTNPTLFITWAKFDHRPSNNNNNNLLIFWLPIETFCKIMLILLLLLLLFSMWWVRHFFHKNPLYEFKWYFFKLKECENWSKKPLLQNNDCFQLFDVVSSVSTPRKI